MGETSAEITALWYGDEVINQVQTAEGEAFFRGAKRIARNIRVRVPRSNKPPTVKFPGHLKDHIIAKRARGKKFKPGAFVFVGNWKEDVYWQYMYEFGTSRYSGRGVVASAIRGNESAVLGEFTTRVRRAINRKRAKAKRLAMGKTR